MSDDQARRDYLATAQVAAQLLARQEVAARWEEPSSLARMSVGALACHLSGQIEFVAQALTWPDAAEPMTSLVDYYSARATWVGTGLDSPTNLRIQEGEAKAATAGAEAMRVGTVRTLAALRADLLGAAARPIRMPVWQGFSLSLDDFVITRMLELVVHIDDLAVSLDVSTPALPAAAVDEVVVLLARVAVRRHGQVDVLRGLARAERAPRTIAAFADA